MLLLAVQYAVQPHLSKKYISENTNKQSVALVEEIVKSVVAAVIYSQYVVPQMHGSIHCWSLSSSVLAAALPAVLYAFQGVLQYVAQINLDPVAYNGLSQTKTLFAALACYLLMGMNQSMQQMLSLTLLFFSATLFQNHRSTANVDVRNESNDLTWWFKGVLPCLGATALSGFAGALSQRGLQLAGGGIGRDPYLYTVEISVYSALTLTVPLLIHGGRNNFSWDGWTYKTLIPILWKALGGILTALVHKSAGSVTKGFALMLGLVLAATFQSICTNKDMSWHHLGGTTLVLFSGWLHFAHPSRP